MNLVLFTNFFPYKKAEPFLVNEFEITQKHASNIKLFTLYGQSQDCTIHPNNKIQLYSPVLDSHQNKKSLFIKGIFNWAPFGFHLKEFFTKKLFLSAAKTYWHLVSAVLTRSVLSSPAYKQLINDLKSQPNTVLYFYWGDNLCWLLPYLKKELLGQKLKVVIRFHGSDLYENLKGNHAPLRALIFKEANNLFTVSEFGKNYLNELYPSFSAKIKLSRLGVKDFGLNPYSEKGTKVVVSVSNLVPLKRVHLIFEALQNMPEPITWYHFGDGPLMSDLLQMTKNAKPGLEIKWMGHVKNVDIMQFYQTQSVDAFMNVSTTEGLPVSIMEAFSFGIPVIATNVGGVSELVNTKTGYLLHKDFRTKELIESIQSIINQSGISAFEIRKQARAAYDEKVSMDNYEAFYSLLEELE